MPDRTNEKAAEAAPKLRSVIWRAPGQYFFASHSNFKTSNDLAVLSIRFDSFRHPRHEYPPSRGEPDSIAVLTLPPHRPHRAELPQWVPQAGLAALAQGLV